METFISLCNSEHITEETKLYDVESLELIAVKDINVFCEALPWRGLEDGFNIAGEKNVTLSNYLDVDKSVSKAKKERERKTSVNKYIVTVILFFTGLFSFGAKGIFEYYMNDAPDSQMFISFMTINIAGAIVSSIVLMVLFWHFFKGVRRKNTVMVVTTLLACVAVYFFVNSLVKYSNIGDQEKLSREKMIYMSRSILSDNVLKKEEFTDFAFGEYVPLMISANQFYMNVQGDLKGARERVINYRLEGILNVETYKSLFLIDDARNKISKYLNALTDSEKRLKIKFDEYLIETSKVSIVEGYKMKYADGLNKIVKDSNDIVDKFYNGERESALRIDKILEFMRENRDKYIVTYSEVKFLESQDEVRYNELVADFYNNVGKGKK